MASGSSDAATSAMASGSSDAGNVCPWPASILLLEKGYLAARGNDTTARARSMDNHTVEVTFWIADPPAASFYTLNCIKAPEFKDVDVDRRVHAVVVGAHGRFVLIRTRLSSDGLYEYFIYKGHPKSPSLESIPLVPFDDMLNGAEFGIVPRGDDGHYLLVALRDMARSNHFRLYIYSSEDTKWMTKELTNPCPVGKILDDKVFTLGDGSVLFVDLLKGMLTCDLLQEQEPLRAQYIPLPEPLPGNREKVKKYLPGVRLFRDLTCVDGLIKFIEIENRVIEREIVTAVPPEKPVDPRTKDVFYDSELISLSKLKPVEIKPKIQRIADGSSAIMWTRKIGSNFWLKGSVVDVNDILVDDSVFSALLSKSKNKSAGSLTFKDMSWIRPTLSTDGNDILYLKTFNQQLDLSVVAAIDLVEKTLKLEAPAVHKFGKYPQVQQVLRPCALANQLKITPGIKVSADLIALMHTSANEPNSTLSVWVSPIPMILRTNVQGSWMRMSTMHKLELRVLYRMFLSHRPILIKTICLRGYPLTGTSSLATVGTHHGPIRTTRRRRHHTSTTGLDPTTLSMHHRSLHLTYKAMSIINHCRSSHYCRSSRLHLAWHLDLTWHTPSTLQQPVWSQLPWRLAAVLTHTRMMLTQALASTISISAGSIISSLFSCLPMQLSSKHAVVF